ncbi:hypothetical protein ACFVZ3_34490 [Kitasatospora purpeofusca]|uniref:hypothetical protein n=1 Tax=Kitasatospora purpeofusca TaxID=67352 RepID=UPI00367F66B3
MSTLPKAADSGEQLRSAMVEAVRAGGTICTDCVADTLRITASAGDRAGFPVLLPS